MIGFFYNKKGFVIYYAIIMTMLLVLFAAAASRIIDSNRLYLEFENSIKNSTERYKNAASIAFKMDNALNANGTKDDTLSCVGGVITCLEGSGAVCSSNTWGAGADGIPDTCNNDDFKGSYSSGNVTNVLSSGSKFSDDDDLARRRQFGFILPFQTEQVFIMNSEVKQAILMNSNNTGPALLPSSTADIHLRGNFSGTGMGILIEQLDPAAYATTKTPVIVRSFSGAVMVHSGGLMSNGLFDSVGTPFSLKIGSFDYVIFVSNPSPVTVFFELSAFSQETPVYIVPLNDSVTPKTLLVPDYRYYGDEMIYRSQTLKE